MHNFRMSVNNVFVFVLIFISISVSNWPRQGGNHNFVLREF